MSRFKTALLAATLAAAPLLAIGGIAHAQRALVYDPAQLPEIKGKLAQYTLTPRGDVDGFILDDGTEVHLPPHASTQLVFAVRPGDAVTIHGLKAKAVPMVAAVSVANDATGATVLAGRGPRPGAGEPVEVEGRIKAVLHTPRGDVNGALLDNGAIVRLPPPEAKRLEATLKPGQTIVATGEGYAGPLGKSVAARRIGADRANLTEVQAPHRGWPEGARGPRGHGPRDEMPMAPRQ